MTVKAKICGLTTAVAVDAAVAGGAAFVGFVFYPPSPRALAPGAAAALIARVPAGIEKVGLFVDPQDGQIEAVLRDAQLTMLQLHGREAPDRVAAIRSRFGLPVIKALPIESAEDFDAAARYADLCDWLMFDAKPPRSPDSLPGGNAQAFDWRLLRDRAVRRPWLLAGGLDPDNVADAIRLTRARAVDVSSGVERAKGDKAPARIAAFLEAIETTEVSAAD